MKTRTKWFLGVLAATVVISTAVTGEPQILVAFAVLGFLVWLAWRILVFVSLLFKPLRDAIRPQTQALNAHVDDTLRRSGLGQVADFGARVDAGVSQAIESTQQGLDARHK